MKARTSKFRSLTLFFAMTLLAMMSLSVQSSAKPTVTTFNAPGAGANENQGTGALSMNDAGVIVGAVIDPWGFIHGFVRAADGDTTIFNVPHALDTIIYSINNSGEIAGTYIDASGVEHGFLSDVDGGNLRRFDVPGAADTEAVAINDDGTIAGNYLNQRGIQNGFVRDVDGNFTTFDAPGAEGTQVITNGLNASGATTGYKVYGQDEGQAFLRSPDGTEFPTFDVYGALFTYAYGINASSTVVGYSWDLADVYHGYRRVEDGTITQIDDPKAGVALYQGTQAYAINSTNWVTGAYADPHNKIHGFVLSPKGVFTTFDISGAVSIYPAFINSAGMIAGYFYDKNYAYHSFVRNP